MMSQLIYFICKSHLHFPFTRSTRKTFTPHSYNKVALTNFWIVGAPDKKFLQPRMPDQQVPDESQHDLDVLRRGNKSQAGQTFGKRCH